MRHATTLLVVAIAWGAFSFGAVYDWAYWPLALALTAVASSGFGIGDSGFVGIRDSGFVGTRKSGFVWTTSTLVLGAALRLNLSRLLKGNVVDQVARALPDDIELIIHG